MDDSTFVRRLAEWQPFYSTVAAAAATLTGLLFVSLSINRDKLAAKENRVFLRIAMRSFGDYLFVLGVALVMLIPRQDPDIFALTLFVISVMRMVRVIGDWWHPVYKHVSRRSGGEIAREYALPVGSCLGMCAVAAAIHFNHFSTIYWLVFILLELMLTASRNALKLLLLESGS